MNSMSTLQLCLRPLVALRPQANVHACIKVMCIGLKRASRSCVKRWCIRSCQCNYVNVLSFVSDDKIYQLSSAFGQCCTSYYLQDSILHNSTFRPALYELVTSTQLLKYTVVKVRGPGGQPPGQGGLAPCSGLSPLLLMKKYYIMHKMCQILHPHRRLRPMSLPPSSARPGHLNYCNN